MEFDQLIYVVEVAAPSQLVRPRRLRLHICLGNDETFLFIHTCMLCTAPRSYVYIREKVEKNPNKIIFKLNPKGRLYFMQLGLCFLVSIFSIVNSCQKDWSTFFSLRLVSIPLDSTLNICLLEKQLSEQDRLPGNAPLAHISAGDFTKCVGNRPRQFHVAANHLTHGDA